MNMEGVSGSERQRGEPLMNPHTENLRYPHQHFQQSLDSPGRKEILMESDGGSGPRGREPPEHFHIETPKDDRKSKQTDQRKRTKQAKTPKSDEVALAALAPRARSGHVDRSECDTSADHLSPGPRAELRKNALDAGAASEGAPHSCWGGIGLINSGETVNNKIFCHRFCRRKVEKSRRCGSMF